MNLKGSPYENNAIFKFWNVIYPIFIYFVAINLAVSLFAVFAAFSGGRYSETAYGAADSGGGGDASFYCPVLQERPKGTHGVLGTHETGV